MAPSGEAVQLPQPLLERMGNFSRPGCFQRNARGVGGIHADIPLSYRPRRCCVENRVKKRKGGRSLLAIYYCCAFLVVVDCHVRVFRKRHFFSDKNVP